MKQIRLLTLLALLMTAATGAWADDLSESFTTNTSASVYTGEHFTITGSQCDEDGFYLYKAKSKTVTITSKNGEVITMIEMTYTWGLQHSASTSATAGTVSADGMSVTNINGTTVTISTTADTEDAIQIDHWKIYYGDAPAVPKHLITATHDGQTRSLEQPLPYATTIGELYEAVTGKSFSDLISTMSALEMPLTGISSNNTSVVSIGELNGASTPVTVTADGKATVGLKFGNYVKGIFVNAVSPLYVTLNDGAENPTTWTASTDGTNFGALPIGGLKEGDAVTLKYNGRLKVKSVTATSDAAPAKVPATVTTAPQATTGDIKAGSTTALVSGGVADGGTLMYAVTTENTKPTSTEGFSADVPTAEGRTAGTYYVWYYVKADDSHIDSEISATAVSVTVKAAVTTVTWENLGFIGTIHDGESRSKDGVTVKALKGMVDDMDNRFRGVDRGNSFQFSTSLGKFTKIEVTCSFRSVDNGNGWSSNVWTGSASTVNFGEYFTPTKIVFTIEPTN